MKKGDTVYVPTTRFDRTDLIGGLARITDVGKLASGVEYIAVREHSGMFYEPDWLAALQAELRIQFGENVAHEGPDHFTGHINYL